MILTVAVQMDPIERIAIAGDSTFALLLEAQARGHRLLYYTPDRLGMRGARVFAKMQPLAVRDVRGDHFTLGEPVPTDLGDVDVVLLRQDPPFDLAYITTTHLLEHVQPEVLVVNDPAQRAQCAGKTPRDAISRAHAADADHAGTRAIEAFRAEHGEVVMKPLHGYGGAAVFKVAREDPNFGSLFDLFAATFASHG